jgi:hypothetical protein
MSILKNNNFKTIFNLYSSGNFLKTKTKLMTIEKSSDLKKNKSINIISKSPTNLYLNNKDEIIKELKAKISILEDKIKTLENKLNIKKKKESKFHYLKQNNSLKDIKYSIRKKYFSDIFSLKNKNNTNYSIDNGFQTINIDNVSDNQIEEQYNFRKFRNTSNLNNNFSTIENENRLLKTELTICPPYSYKFKNIKYIPKIPKKINSEMNITLSSTNSINIIRQNSKNDFNISIKEKLDNIKLRTEKLISSCLSYI